MTLKCSIENTFEQCEKLLLKKNALYAVPSDVFGNFRKSAELQGRTQKQVLLGYMTKHTVSIADMIASNTIGSKEIVYEKIMDNINYLLILKAMIEEEPTIQILGNTEENKK